MSELPKPHAVQPVYVTLILATCQRSFYRSLLSVLSVVLGSQISRVHKSRICYNLVTWIIIVGSLSNAHGGIVYNAVSEFSTGSNPNGSWSYRFSNDTVRDGIYPLLSEIAPLTDNGSLSWHADPGVSPSRRPWAALNTTSTYGSWLVGELAIHPGQSNLGPGPGLAILSWISTINGTVNVQFSFALGLPGEIVWFFEHNDSSKTLDSGALSCSGSDSISLSNITITPGDRLNFVVDSNGGVGADLLRISSATIEVNAVPEPTSIACFALTFGSVLMQFCRVRKQ